jgi:hypothetical protein
LYEGEEDMDLVGPRTPNSDRAMDVVARIDAEDPDSEENESDDLKPLEELLEKPWWSRAWVIQGTHLQLQLRLKIINPKISDA